MKKLLTLLVLCALISMPASAQNSKTASKMLYHDGPVLRGIRNMYVIWYGCWTNNCGSAGSTKTLDTINDFLATIGNTPYMTINASYTDSTGGFATPTLIYGGEVFDSSYAHGVDLTNADIQAIIADKISNFLLPQDSQGIYLVIASADVASNSTGFCSPGAPPFHSFGMIVGGQLTYAFVGNPQRCPSVAGPQLSPTGPTPHNDYAGDTLASNLAHVLDTTLTNPYGSGWFDRYGLENADKCANTFGPTFQTANGARANIRLGVAAGDYLIQQNWVNDRKPRCAMSWP